MLQVFRNSANQHLEDEDLTKARIAISAIVGLVASDESEIQFVRQTFPKIAEASGEELGTILRMAYDRALRSETRRRNEENSPRQGSFISWMR